MGWKKQDRKASAEKQRRRLARRVAGLIDSVLVPGTSPMTPAEKLLYLLGTTLIFAILFAIVIWMGSHPHP